MSMSALESTLELVVADWRTPVGYVYFKDGAVRGDPFRWIRVSSSKDSVYTMYTLSAYVMLATVFAKASLTFIGFQAYPVYAYPSDCGLRALSMDGTYAAIPDEMRQFTFDNWDFFDQEQRSWLT